MKAAVVTCEESMLNLDKHCLENSVELKLFLFLNENQCADTFPTRTLLFTYIYDDGFKLHGRKIAFSLKRIKNSEIILDNTEFQLFPYVHRT